MIRSILLISLVLGGFPWKGDGLKQDTTVGSSTTSPPTPAVPLATCECDELTRCHGEQVKKERAILSACRQECASKIFLKPSVQKVLQCYDAHDVARVDAAAKQERCLEEMGSRRCHSPNAPVLPQTVQINTTEFLHSGSSKQKNRKIAYPDSIGSLNSCVKMCVKNNGVIEFNPDGTVVKPPKVKKEVDASGGETAKKVKNGKEYSACANQLGCQLASVDKKLDKQAKHLCKLQAGKQDDHEANLCSCLENALGQKLQCTSTEEPAPSSTGTCSKGTSSCPEARKTESKSSSSKEETEENISK